MEDAAPAPKHHLEQEPASRTWKFIHQEEQQGGEKQVTGIHFDFGSGLSLETIRTTVNPPRQKEGLTGPLLLNPHSQYGTEDSGHQLDNDKVSAVTM